MDFVAGYLWTGVLNNLTTWIAAVVVAAAAFRFWKFRNPSPCSVKPFENADSEEQPAPTSEAASLSSAAAEAPPYLALATTAMDAMVFGTTKGKMTLFFGDCRGEEVETRDGGGKDGGGVDVDGAAGERWWSEWGRVVRVRRGETEWYSCQDVEFINGNVVRLWDDVRTRLLPLSYVVC